MKIGQIIIGCENESKTVEKLKISREKVYDWAIFVIFLNKKLFSTNKTTIT